MHTTSTPDPTPTPEPEDTWLENALRQPSASPHARPDDGGAFAARVLAALPAPAAELRRAASRRRWLMAGAGALAGCVCAWAFGGPALIEATDELARLATQAGAHVGAPDAVGIQVLAGASALAALWFAARRDLRRLF